MYFIRLMMKKNRVVIVNKNQKKQISYFQKSILSKKEMINAGLIGFIIGCPVFFLFWFVGMLFLDSKYGLLIFLLSPIIFPFFNLIEKVFHSGNFIFSAFLQGVIYSILSILIYYLYKRFLKRSLHN